jgi:hypothetical protein
VLIPCRQLLAAKVILGGLEPPISSVSGRRPEPLGHRIIRSTPARIRTWNAAFEARNDGPFHHQGRSVQSEKGKVQSWRTAPVLNFSLCTSELCTDGAEGEGFEPSCPCGRTR